MSGTRIVFEADRYRAIPLTTRSVLGRDVQLGAYLAYLDRPFEVTRIEPTEPHTTLGARRIAYDNRGRGVILYDNLLATVIA